VSVPSASALRPASPNPRALAILLVGMVVISFNGIFVALANTFGEVAGFWRLAIAFSVLTAPVLVNRRRKGLRLSPLAIGLGAAAGVAMSADLVSWNTAVLLIGPGMATLLGNTAPIWVSLGAWLIFKEKLRPLYWVGLTVAVVGAALIVGLDLSQGLDTGLGNGLGLVTGVTYAAYQLITHRARALLDTLTYMWVYAGVGAAILLIVSLVFGHSLLGLPLQTYAYLLAMALLSHLGGWMLVNYAFGHLPVSLVTVTLLGQPVITTLLQMIIFQQYPEVWQMGGGVVVLSGILIVHASRAAEPEQVKL